MTVTPLNVHIGIKELLENFFFLNDHKIIK